MSRPSTAISAKRARSSTPVRRAPKTKIHDAFLTVHARELSSIRMVDHNERRFSKVVDNDVVKQWVGVGWVSEGPAESPRDDKFPRVIRD